MRRRGWLLLAAGVGAAGVAAWLARGPGDAPAPAAGARRAGPVEARGLQLTLRAEPLHVVVGGTVRLTADAGRGGVTGWEWVAGAGTLVDDGGGKATWTATGKPGRTTIGVRAEAGAASATAKLTIEVRLPSPQEVADLTPLMQQLAARRAAQTAALAELERSIEGLRATAAQRDSIEDRIRAQGALEELAGVLEQLGRYEEAAAVWAELLHGMLPMDPKFKKFQAGAADVAFMLGDEEGALRGWEAGGDYVQGMSRYYQGEVLERTGDLEGAADAYARAQGGAKWFGDPVYRHALLTLQAGGDAASVAQLLVDASPRLDRDRMLERLRQDPELRPLWEALQGAGRVDDLEAQRALEIDSDAPSE